MLGIKPIHLLFVFTTAIAMWSGIIWTIVQVTSAA